MTFSPGANVVKAFFLNLRIFVSGKLLWTNLTNALAYTQKLVNYGHKRFLTISPGANDILLLGSNLAKGPML
jgi:hypothetical protein